MTFTTSPLDISIKAFFKRNNGKGHSKPLASTSRLNSIIVFVAQFNCRLLIIPLPNESKNHRNKMDYFPVFVKLKDQDCLVVGAGEIAARKIELLVRAGAKITVIAKEISPTVSDLQTDHKLTILQKSFAPTDLRGFRLVVSATDNKETNQLVAKTAEGLNILVNVVDDPGLCSFVFPAIIDRSPVIAAVSSGGAAPVLARLLRSKIESIIPPAYGRLAQLAEKFRTDVKNHIIVPAQRRIFWENIFQGSVAELVFAGNEQGAEQQLQQALSIQKDSVSSGEVRSEEHTSELQSQR